MIVHWADEEWSKRALERNKENSKKVTSARMELGLDPFLGIDRVRAGAATSERNKLSNSAARLQTPEVQKKSRDSMRKLFDTDEEYRLKKQNTARDNLTEYNRKLSTGEVQITDKQRKTRSDNAKRTNFNRFHKNEYESYEQYMEFNNHKVLKIEKLIDVEDVYDLTVDKYENFALSAGVFVHNCAIGYDTRHTEPFVWVRNSWGQTWGINGNFKMPFTWFTDDRRLVDDMWVMHPKK